MVNKIAQGVVARWVKKDIIKDDLRDCYIYGLEVIFLAVIGLVNIIFIAFMTHTVINSIAFLITFITIRKYAGGYHADTCLKCNIVFIAVYIFNIHLVWVYNGGLLILAIITLTVGLSTIKRNGPVESINKKLDRGQKESNKKTVIVLYTVFWGVGLIIYIFNRKIAETVYFTLIEVIFLMLLAKKE